MYSKDINIIKLLLETIEKIFFYTNEIKTLEDFENDTKTFDATLMNFIALGESISKISNNFKEKYNHIDWRKIYAFRNVLAHDYFGILPEEVWQIIINHLPKLKTDLEKILKI